MPLEIQRGGEEKGAQAAAMRGAECERLTKLIPKSGTAGGPGRAGGRNDAPRVRRLSRRGAGTSGTGDLVFAIGGAYGFHRRFRSRPSRTSRLSRMTLTHQMVRVFLLEQIYRGFTIMNSEPYHH